MRTKQTSKRIRTVRRHRLALALVGAMAMPAAPALAQNLPESGAVVNSNVQPNTMVGGAPAQVLREKVTWKR